MQKPDPKTYDAVARQYFDKYANELDSKPFDRQQLDALAASIRPGGQVADLGCGPGHVGAYLSAKGFKVVGLDVSEGMLALARVANPSIRYEHADLLALNVPKASWAGAVAAYSLIHVPQVHLIDVLRAIHKGLEPGGPFLASFHQGTGVNHVDTLLGEAVSLNFYFYDKEEVIVAFVDAGFEIMTVMERGSYPNIEMQTRQRVYVLARAI